MREISLALVSLSVVIWLWLLGFRGQFWQSDVVLEWGSGEDKGGGEDGRVGRVDDFNSTLKTQNLNLKTFPSVCAVIPARNETDVLPLTLPSLLQQNYAGAFRVILVDDHSSDGTAEVAKQVAEELAKADQVQIITAKPLPVGWSGKLWAMQQGVEATEAFAPDYLLFTDADIQHDPENLQQLMQRAMGQDLDLASVMVRLRCESAWERLLIPAFVFFFQKLYPFRWVNDPRNATAAAAGGCILIRKAALARIGGLQTIRQTLIDDCALAQAVKRSAPAGQGRIWLGLSDQTCSLRSYPSLQSIWDMTARTAFTQLNYSFLLLLGTVLGMSLVYLVPVIGCLLGMESEDLTIALIGFTGWMLMSFAYWPTVRFYRCSFIFAFSLPLIALLYTLMTIDSALRYWQGRGGAWKGRVYPSQS
jgi:hopene-associated glycosyltransferase HpnB